VKQPRRLTLSKHHGAGNDFLVLLDPDDHRPVSSAEARALCDRRRGVGADGLLRATAGSAPGALRMELYNADGGVAEMSGNGARCLVQAAVDGGLVESGRVTLETLGGRRWVEYRRADAPGLGYGRVGMGTASLGAEFAGDVEVPVDDLARVRWGRWVDMGNPHLVLFGAPVDGEMVARLGPELSARAADGANIEFAWPGPGAGELTLRVWERGVGETLACGTGTCAVAAAARAHDEVGVRVRVHNPGGPLDVELDGDEIVLAGPTQTVAVVHVDEDVLASWSGAEAGVTPMGAVDLEVARRP
jgi:diaminopimelate epimerase